ncbi:MAG: family 20 glycosylhydrolase [Rhodobacteraceae bacterium]|nr:family 20 glycosylhydrolase [Paracoccaceae bacterium]
MNLDFEAKISDDEIICIITSGQPLTAPIFCFSLFVPIGPVSGGKVLRTDAGYCEIALPDLAAGAAHRLTLRHNNPDFKPANRAWLPLGAYLRCGNSCHALPPVLQGVLPGKTVEFSAFDGLRIVPQPTGWQPSIGTVKLDLLANGSEPLRAVDALGKRSGLGPLLGKTGTKLRLHIDPNFTDEAYQIQINPDGIEISASRRAGLFYAGITLLTLRQTHDGNLPCGTLTDQPRFGWRGQHLDCARHFFAPQSITQLLDLMALLKLNRFHWHFADDEAFRLELDCAPDLAKHTGFRGEGELMPGVFGGGISAGGTYSKADVARLIAHAKTLNIEIMPEIEIPAHSAALARARPGLRDPDDTGCEVSIQGYTQNVLNPALPEVWALWHDISDEISAMFPFGIIHLGGDELPPKTWAGSAKAASLMAQYGLKTPDDLLGWTLARLATRLAKRGIRCGAWEEAAKGCGGGISNNAILFSWTGAAPGFAAAKRGYDVVMCPAQNMYLEMATSQSTEDWGASWAATFQLEEVINWEPVPPQAADFANNIIGVQGAYWAEFTTQDVQMQPLIAPRILGIAVMGWAQADQINGAQLRQLAGHYRGVFDAIGWVWDRNA